jgi:hypothetical protein
MLPKTVWAYWDNESPLPKLEELCMATWQNRAGWTVHLVRPSGLAALLGPGQLPSNFSKLDHSQRRSDAVRLALLARYGGIYLDCTVILRESLDWVWPLMKTRGHEFLAQTHDKALQNHSTWFLACIPEQVFVTKWAAFSHREMETKLSGLRYDRIQFSSQDVRRQLCSFHLARIGFMSSLDNGLSMVIGALNPSCGPIDSISVAALEAHEQKLGHPLRLVKLNRAPRDQVRRHVSGVQRLRPGSAIVGMLE